MRDNMKYNPYSLYYRLNPVHLEYLLSNEPSFPHTISGMLGELRTESNWVRLSYDCVCNLVNFLNLNDYSPTTMDSLFKNK
jgi:hypothetical protein